MSTTQDVLLSTDLPGIPLRARGKVRDIYEAGNDHLLIVATDRISAFDYILATGIPMKGRVLTQLSLFWFDFFKDIVPNHLVTADLDRYPATLQSYQAQLEYRSMLVKEAKMLPVECVARGYLSGSGWKDYLSTGAVCGIPLPPGLRESDRLPEAIFTPATKAESGHDENIPFEQVSRLLGDDLARQVRDLTLRLYSEAAEYAANRGILIADTKFEFGLVDDRLVLADEALTPDSSRFWPADQYKPGGPQPSYDKQYVRDYLESIRWNKQPPAPALPDDVAQRTSEKYQEAHRVLTGRHL
ncbi:MAG TPA: phosphoribosylaminoimidazolesuccinocarboxamide synthase [Bryobacteraceae bacterium]|nr:phosphoribosylaminoimidazolesuccinocarboxamide synthase [Bryobacteraceae bacterium]